MIKKFSYTKAILKLIYKIFSLTENNNNPLNLNIN